MALIHLLDGTDNQKFGKALIRSFSEIAKYQPVFVEPKPGSIDIEIYKLVQNAQKVAFKAQRNQSNYSEVLETILNLVPVLIGENTLILSDNDLYHGDLNWCFGAVTSDIKGGKHLLMSVYRLNDLDMLAHVGTHELGHIFDATRYGRINTEENLGPHCTNLCVMQQKLSVPEMAAHARTLFGKKDKFCYDCAAELRKYSL